MSALHDTIHWIIDHLNVTQEEKDEQHTAVTDAAAPVATSEESVEHADE